MLAFDNKMKINILPVNNHIKQYGISKHKSIIPTNTIIIVYSIVCTIDNKTILIILSVSMIPLSINFNRPINPFMVNMFLEQICNF